jgi:hypothetical protein
MVLVAASAHAVHGMCQGIGPSKLAGVSVNGLTCCTWNGAHAARHRLSCCQAAAPLLKSDDGVPSPPVGACCHVGPVPLHSIQPNLRKCSHLTEVAAVLLEAPRCRPAAMLPPMGQIQLREAWPHWERTPHGLGVVGCVGLAG